MLMPNIHVLRVIRQSQNSQFIHATLFLRMHLQNTLNQSKLKNIFFSISQDWKMNSRHYHDVSDFEKLREKKIFFQTRELIFCAKPFKNFHPNNLYYIIKLEKTVTNYRMKGEC